jgi:short-subunit dehydrogenase
VWHKIIRSVVAVLVIVAFFIWSNARPEGNNLADDLTALIKTGQQISENKKTDVLLNSPTAITRDIGWNINGNRAIVIGASTGIGRELARVFCANGYQVGGVSRNQAALEALQQELGESFVFAVGDVQTDESIDIVKQLIQQIGGCDIFVMNAGIWDDARDDMSTTALASLDWQQLLTDQLNTIETNIAGFTRMGAVAFEYFLQQRKGHFVGVSSVDAVRGNPYCAVYSGTKSFESTYMQGWRSAFELAGIPIKISDIRPGFVETYPLPTSAFWVERVDVAAWCIFNAIKNQKEVAYITDRWESFAEYLVTVPASIYNFMAANFGIK